MSKNSYVKAQMNLLKSNTKFKRAVELLMKKYGIKRIMILQILLSEIRILIRMFNETSLSELNAHNKLLCLLLWRNVCKEVELRQTKALSCTDPLTGLANRRAIDSALNRSIKKVLRSRYDCSNKAKYLYLMTIDIDHFKNINDTHGHKTGDKVLILVAEILRDLTRTDDHCGRCGGEEFIMTIMLDSNQETDVIAIAKRLLSNISKLDLSKIGINNRITVSIGISRYIKNEDPEELKSRSDQALYKAKRDGRNCVVFYDSK